MKAPKQLIAIDGKTLRSSYQASEHIGALVVKASVLIDYTAVCTTALQTFLLWRVGLEMLALGLWLGITLRRFAQQSAFQLGNA